MAVAAYTQAPENNKQKSGVRLQVCATFVGAHLMGE
jgi:hypothetical protein